MEYVVEILKTGMRQSVSTWSLTSGTSPLWQLMLDTGE